MLSNVLANVLESLSNMISVILVLLIGGFLKTSCILDLNNAQHPKIVG